MNEEQYLKTIDRKWREKWNIDKPKKEEDDDFLEVIATILMI